MAKNSKRKKKFNKNKKRASKKFKSIGNNSNKSETDYCLNISLVKWACKFLEQFPYPKKNNFDKKFFNILKKLKFNENEFVEFILYIEHYINETKNHDLQSIFYLGLLLKESFGSNSSQNHAHITNKKKLAEIKLIFDEIKIDVIEFNKKFNDFSNYKKQKKFNYIGLNSMVNYICNPSSENEIINEEENIEEDNADNLDDQENQDNPYNHPIPVMNVTREDINITNIRFETENPQRNIFNEESDAINLRLSKEMIDRDNEHLPRDDDFMRLDKSYENLNNINSRNFLFQIKKTL